MTDSDRTGATPDPAERAPRTEGEVTRPPAIQAALVILVVFLILLALGVLWPLLNGG